MNYLFIGFLAAVVSSTVAVAQNLSPFRVPDVWKRFTTNSFSQGPQRFVSDGKGGLMFWFQMLDRVNDQLTGAPILLRADGSVDPVFKPGILGFSVDSVAPAPGGRWWVAYSLALRMSV